MTTSKVTSLSMSISDWDFDDAYPVVAVFVAIHQFASISDAFFFTENGLGGTGYTDNSVKNFHVNLVEVAGWHSTPTERLDPFGVKLVDEGFNELGFAVLKVDEVFDLLHNLHPEVDRERLKVVALKGVNADAVNGGVDEVLDLRGIDVHRR